MKRIINGMINGTIKLSETATIFVAIFSDEKFVQEVLAQITMAKFAANMTQNLCNKLLHKFYGD